MATQPQDPKDPLLENIDLIKQVYENETIGRIIIQSTTRRIVAANKSALNLFGATKDQLIGTLCQAAICSAPTCQCPIIDRNQTAWEEEQIITSRTMGKQIPILRLARKDVVHGEEYIIESIVDISKTRYETQKNHEKSCEHKILFSENPQAVAICDKDFGVAEVNLSFTRLFGCSAASIKGQDAINMFTPKNHMAENSRIKEQIRLRPITCQTKRQRPDGQEINVTLYGGPTTNYDGKISGFVLTFQDNTEAMAVREELNILLEEQNLSLGQTRLLNEQLNVTSGLTRHDIRNKLTALTFKAYLAKKRCKENPEVYNCLTDIEAISNSIARLLEVAKTYELLGTQEQVQINVGEIVADAVSLFVDLKGVNIINECEEVEVIASSLLLELFHNMIDNSLKYGPPKITEIRIYARINTIGATEIIYEDNGNGIDPSIKDRLFGKGVTTKGTGYGLWLIRRICEMYGWSVKEIGVYGRGVRFVMTIPNDLSNAEIVQFRTKPVESEQLENIIWQ
jgi:PAS domain S-box-containing protein